MDDLAPTDDCEGALNVQLDVHLDRRPVAGRIRTPDGGEERFVGWLGFVEAMHRAERHSTSHLPTPEGASDD
jgi:hypothetical protein